MGIKTSTDATLVGYREGTAESGRAWARIDFATGGSVFSGFLSDGCRLNGERDKLDAGEVIPVTLDVEFSPQRSGAGVNVLAIKPRASK